MSEAHRRRKAPDLVKERIINAATELLTTGVPLSMATVAEIAEVSKGAVQHHFGTREELFAAIYQACLHQLNAKVAKGDANKSSAWNYVQAIFQLETSDTRNTWRALLVAAVIDRTIARKWSVWMQESRKLEGDESARSLVARLAADGLWLADVLGTYNLNGTEREAISREICGLTAERDE